MENSPLNLAHLEARRAQRFKKSGCLEEALECHSRAIELLNKAAALSSSNLVFRSLDWQQNHHQREARLLQLKLAVRKTDKMPPTKEESHKVTNSQRESLVAGIFRNLAQSSEALGSYLNDFPESESEPRLALVLEANRLIGENLKQLFPDVNLESDESSSNTTPVENQAPLLPQLTPLEIPHFDFGIVNDN